MDRETCVALYRRMKAEREEAIRILLSSKRHEAWVFELNWDDVQIIYNPDQDTYIIEISKWNDEDRYVTKVVKPSDWDSLVQSIWRRLDNL
jgi:hypothetical protein